MTNYLRHFLRLSTGIKNAFEVKESHFALVACKKVFPVGVRQSLLDGGKEMGWS